MKEELVDLVELKSDLLTNNYTAIFYEKDYRHNAPSRFAVVDNVDFTENEDVESSLLSAIKFQGGPIKECGINGVMNEDLIAMVIKRLECFQDSKFKCDENEQAINHLRAALVVLRKRTNKRAEKGIEGTNNV